MTREIKFRIWDKDNNKMLHYDNDIVPCLTLNGVLQDCSKEVSSNVSYKYELMQFTGLLDKNGNEIWEGDIIKCKYPFDGEAIGEIYFDNMTYKLKSLNQSEEAIKRGYNDFIEYWSDGEYDWDTLEQIMDSEMEVIGNIYQNKDLIN